MHCDLGATLHDASNDGLGGTSDGGLGGTSDGGSDGTSDGGLDGSSDGNTLSTSLYFDLIDESDTDSVSPALKSEYHASDPLRACVYVLCLHPTVTN